jgi:hypothetical protein
MSLPEKTERNAEIIAAIRAGRTIVEVAREHGISHARARQIYCRPGRVMRAVAGRETPVGLWLAEKLRARPAEERLGFVRASAVLNNHRIETFDQLCDLDAEQLTRMPNMGRRTIALLRELLAEDGLKLRGE